jgi:uncharacterized protein YeaO (DUF488 family)
MVRVKRAYEPASSRDGYRVLVDRLWPRGLRKEDAALDAWLKELAPSDALRKWFGHDPTRWQDFRERYERELRRPDAQSELGDLARRAAEKTVTLVYAAHDEEHNNAVVLAEKLESRRSVPPRPRRARRAPRAGKLGTSRARPSSSRTSAATRGS